MDYLLYNPLSSNNHGSKILETIDVEKYQILDITKINLDLFLQELKDNDQIYLAGGDGTISIFSRHYHNNKVSNKIYLIKNGTGNDFLKDLNTDETIIELNEYISNLPIVEVNGKKYTFINGIGYGIDGDVCKYAEIARQNGKKKINYTLIAVKLLLFKYKGPNAIVKVDGKEYKYKRVWLAATMLGRCYGGGMFVAPEQDRKSNLVSLVVMHTANKLHALIAFPSIFSGKLARKKKYVNIFKGKEIEVTFDTPTSLQIDGEVIFDVLSYKVKY